MELHFLIVVCCTIIIIVGIIATSCVRYYSSDNKRKLMTFEEKYNNIESLMRHKDSVYSSNLKTKEDECLRMADIIKTLTEKQQRYSVDANIKTDS